MKNLETPRLILRRWRPEDIDPFHRINSDPQVMEFFPAPLTLDQTRSLVSRIESSFVEKGFGLWAAELKANGEMIGFIGLSVPAFGAPFMPCVEIGWRLSPAHWGKGLASEGARCSLEFAFRDLGLPEVVSFTSGLNQKSRRVMEKIGMAYNPADDFDHPLLPEGHWLRPHVLYRVRKDTQGAAT